MQPDSGPIDHDLTTIPIVKYSGGVNDLGNKVNG